MITNIKKILTVILLGSFPIFSYDGSEYVEEIYETVQDRPDTVLPEYCYWLEAVSVFGDTIYLNDGSGWKVMWLDRNYFSSSSSHYWQKNTPLLIMKNRGWLKFGYEYIAYNINTGECAAIDLVSFPEACSPYLTTVVEIDHNTCSFVLNNGTRWIATSNREELHQWLEGDGIIIGALTCRGYNNSMELLFINSYRKTNLQAMRI